MENIPINFNNCISKELINRYGGSERKKTVIMLENNKPELYLLKLPDPIRENSRNLSYINNSISEYLGCKIFKSIGFDVQDVKLGQYTAENGKIYIACACKNIVPDGYVLAEAENTSLGSENDSHEAQSTKITTIFSIAKNISDIDENKLIQWYYDMFIVDAFIGNTDRHNGNWGFLSSPTNTIIAPIYDCGSSFSPLLDDIDLNEHIALIEAKGANSVLSDENGKRIKYYDFLSSTKNLYVHEALKRIIPRIDMKKIAAIIDETPYITDKRKTFYRSLLKIRYEQILLPALENSLSQHPVQSLPSQDCYSFYKQIIEPLSNVNIGEKETALVNNKITNIFRVSNKYMLFYNENQSAECIISLRSSNKDIEKTKSVLEHIYGNNPVITIEAHNKEIETNYEER